MPKMNLIFLSLFWGLNSFAAVALAFNFDVNHLRYSPTGDLRSENTATLEWNNSKQICQLKIPGEAQFKKIAPKKCADVQQQIKDHWKEFALLLRNPISAKTRMLNEPPHQKFAELQIANRSIGVLKNKIELCDEHLENCKLQKRNVADDLGEMIRELVSENI